MDTFAERLAVLQSEAERLKHYLRTLPATSWERPSACSAWTVQDVVAHLIGVAETYTSGLTRGLRGDTAPPPGRLPAGQASGALSANGIAQRAIAVRQALDTQVLDTFEATNDRLTQLLAALTPAQRDLPCYHPGGIVAAHNFIDLRLKELAVHEWDIRAGLEDEAHLAAACLPAILATVSESIASGSLRWAFWSGPQLATPVRYRFLVAGPAPRQSDIIVAGDTLRMEDAGTTPATVTMQCDAETYVLLIYGRLPLETALASGQVRLTGDRDTALAFGQWFRGI